MPGRPTQPYEVPLNPGDIVSTQKAVRGVQAWARLVPEELRALRERIAKIEPLAMGSAVMHEGAVTGYLAEGSYLSAFFDDSVRIQMAIKPEGRVTAYEVQLAWQDHSSGMFLGAPIALDVEDDSFSVGWLNAGALINPSNLVGMLSWRCYEIGKRGGEA